MDSERELVEMASSGNEIAFTQLFHLYKHKLYSFTLRLVNDPHAAEDIVQDIFLKLWNNRTQLAAVHSFGSYVFQMAQNQSINSFRRMASETLILSELFHQQSAADLSTEQAINFRETQTIVAAIVEKLPPQQKLVYQLSREKGLKHEEIAEQLKLAPSTVKNHLIQALNTIREQLRTHAVTFFLLASLLISKK
ncbi:RNA polymerase sigma factor [Spirosoma sp. KNUC1025]|uniref:RNA polymerase sigma factor n=1 Tax=Spirosoma sp. KNUC1025 TaxID=2894082 RepID=UPI00386E1697|nr:RNA polymerase sigma-70 factor [Spirosoma sp. KNUC1025]